MLCDSSIRSSKASVVDELKLYSAIYASLSVFWSSHIIYSSNRYLYEFIMQLPMIARSQTILRTGTQRTNKSTGPSPIQKRTTHAGHNQTEKKHKTNRRLRRQNLL